ncbi:MAG: hypothetical protein ACI89T_002187 [Cognaticolwellia sp.]|jgi:hypothetical protein
MKLPNEKNSNEIPKVDLEIIGAIHWLNPPPNGSKFRLLFT